MDIDEMFDDPVLRAVMASDGLSEADVRRALARAMPRRGADHAVRLGKDGTGPAGASVRRAK